MVKERENKKGMDVRYRYHHWKWRPVKPPADARPQGPLGRWRPCPSVGASPPPACLCSCHPHHLTRSLPWLRNAQRRTDEQSRGNLLLDLIFYFFSSFHSFRTYCRAPSVAMGSAARKWGTHPHTVDAYSICSDDDDDDDVTITIRDVRAAGPLFRLNSNPFDSVLWAGARSFGTESKPT